MAASSTPDDKALRILLDMLVRFEGVYLQPYLCPAGIATIGLGTTVYPDGRRVRLTDPPIDVATAKALASHWLSVEVLPKVRSLCSNVSSPESLAALADFAYNLGVGALANSTLRRRVLAGDVDGACAELAKWVRGGGVVLPGLVRRRAAEAALLRAGGLT